MESSLPPSNQQPKRQTKLRRKSSPDDSAEGSRKPRASKPKVRTGCLTCKTRRVKCDEAKPGCLRCEKFGRACDGYNLPPSRKVIQLQPRITTSLNVHTPTVLPHRSEEEYRYLGVFINRTAFELSGYYENPFWHETVLQASQHSSAIRYAVIALGALNESLHHAPRPNLKVNISQSMDQRHRINAFQSYHNAVQLLNHYLLTASSPQIRTTLIACLLIICFETIQGNVASSVLQTYGGLQILRQHYVGPGPRPWIPARATLDKNAKLRAEKISQTIISRLGCAGIYKQRAMMMHVEDYLAGVLESPNLGREPKPFMEQTSGVDEFPIASSKVGLPGAIGSTSFRKELNDVEGSHSDPESAETLSNDSGTVTIQRPSVFATAMQTFDSSTGSTQSVVPTRSALTPEDPHTPSSPSQSPPSAAPKEDVSRKRRRSPEPNTSKQRNLFQNDEFIEDSIFQAFVRLDGQGMFFGTVPGIPPLIWDIHSLWHLPIPSSFNDFPEAQKCWDFLMDRAVQFYRRTLFNAAYKPAQSQSRDEIVDQLTFYISQLESFEAAFSPILSAAIGPDGRVASPAPLVLSLYQKVVLIMLGRILEDSEMVYDRYIPHFKYIVSTASLLIDCEGQFGLPRNPRFSFDIGIVPPLHVTATRCRDPVVRREAIALLFKSPRQEGMWDGILSARVGCWLVKQEEVALPLPYLPPGLEELSSKEMRNGFASSPNLSDELAQAGVNYMMRRPEVVNMITDEEMEGDDGSTTSDHGSETDSMSEFTVLNKGWEVPEKNRIQLTTVDYFVPERNIQIHGTRVVAEEDGTRLQLISTMAW